jgi:hypothetical protein
MLRCLVFLRGVLRFLLNDFKIVLLSLFFFFQGFFIRIFLNVLRNLQFSLLVGGKLRLLNKKRRKVKKFLQSRVFIKPNLDTLSKRLNTKSSLVGVSGLEKVSVGSVQLIRSKTITRPLLVSKVIRPSRVNTFFKVFLFNTRRIKKFPRIFFLSSTSRDFLDSSIRFNKFF